MRSELVSGPVKELLSPFTKSSCFNGQLCQVFESDVQWDFMPQIHTTLFLRVIRVHKQKNGLPSPPCFLQEQLLAMFVKGPVV